MTERPSGGNGRWLRAAWQAGAILAMATFIALTANSLRPTSLPLVADWSIKAQLVSAAVDHGENIPISLEEAEILYFARDAVFLDARSEEAFRMGHIEGARNLPWEDFEAKFAEVMADVPLDSKIVTYCDGESCSLSKELAIALLTKGYPNIRVLVNGWTVWLQANLPVEG